MEAKTTILKLQKKLDQNYDKAETHIRAAIECLGAEAINGDTKAKESIANLGVVLLDLKSK